MPGAWINVSCSVPDCPNYGGYWSNTGRPKRDKKEYHCEDHKVE